MIFAEHISLFVFVFRHGKNEVRELWNGLLTCNAQMLWKMKSVRKSIELIVPFRVQLVDLKNNDGSVRKKPIKTLRSIECILPPQHPRHSAPIIMEFLVMHLAYLFIQILIWTYRSGLKPQQFFCHFKLFSFLVTIQLQFSLLYKEVGDLTEFYCLRIKRLVYQDPQQQLDRTLNSNHHYTERHSYTQGHYPQK